jgi:DNA processing protein
VASVDGTRPAATVRPCGDPAVSMEVRAALALERIPGLGPMTIRWLIDEYGSAAAVAGRRVARLPQGCRRDLRALIADARPVPAGGVSLLPGARIVSYGGEGYPRGLERLRDPPPVLYLRGTLSPSPDKAVAIVGTRRATEYGRRVARTIAVDLAAAGWAIVSGLARGVDSAAHRGALDAGGQTVGVLGCGLGHVYPASNRELYRAVAESGLLVSEHPPGLPPEPAFFPRRNRIIAAMSRAVVVVQAGVRSGALITADHALDIGLEVFAIPGQVDLPASAGVNRLLADGANLATDARDVLEVLGATYESPRPPARGDRPAEPPGGFGPLADALRTHLEQGPSRLDELAWNAGVGVPEALAMLSRLELAGAVRGLPGARFELMPEIRIAHAERR